jgi:hydrogenase 3 maturation protease
VVADLENLLCETGRRLLFVGIGNVLKQDDGAGVYISMRLNPGHNIDVITAEVSIENYIGKINSLNPDILILIDALEMGMPPGTFRLLPLEEIVDMTFNTHNISLRRLSDFFRAEVYILGIQPASVDFGEKTSYLVRREANKIINLINKREVNHGS